MVNMIRQLLLLRSLHVPNLPEDPLQEELQRKLLLLLNKVKMLNKLKPEVMSPLSGAIPE